LTDSGTISTKETKRIANQVSAEKITEDQGPISYSVCY
jgi:hypothetical protein